MCAIAGILNTKERPVSRGVLQRMIDVQAHRGPDGEGVYLEGPIGLGHRRLSIIDLSKAGAQPMHSSNGRYVLTFNGEIYNYKELKKALRGRKWKSSSDSEVLLAAYEEWGKECVKKFNGIFAFAIWDTKKKELFCARDHLGVKPFYYSFKNGKFIFASEIKGLLAAGVQTAPNERLLYDFLAHGYYHHTNESFFEGIVQLPAGHTLTVAGGVLRIEPFWDLAAEAKKIYAEFAGASDAEVTKRFGALFEDAVRLQLRSDVPVGMQLSGGLDSSAVVAMAHRVFGGQKNARLFSFIYGGYDDKEALYMRSLARGLGWKLEITKVLPRDMVETAERALWHQDEPFPGLPTFGEHLLARKCRQEGIPVILGGQGGDEVAAGYEYYMGAFFVDALREGGAPHALRELRALAARRKNLNPEHFFARSIAAYLRGGTSADTTSFVRPEVLTGAFAARALRARPAFPEPFPSALANMQYRDITAAKLPRILHAADRSAMAHGVEHRVPLLDYRLVAFGVGLPNRFNIREGVQKHFMRETLKKLMPARVLHSPKRSVPSPQREWFKKELRPWLRSILESKSFKSRPYLNQRAVLAEYEKYCTTPGVPENSFHLWQWLHLELWLRKYFD